MDCENCIFCEYDDDYEEYICSVDMDEDDYARLMKNDWRECPYFRSSDDYLIVRKQM